jgi:hypothetical protein
MAVIGAAWSSGCIYKQDPIGPIEDYGGTTIQGTIDGVLTASQSPYRVENSLIVDSGKVLVVQAGVVLRFADSAGLVVKGRLLIEGKAGDGVLMTSLGSLWRGILVTNGQSGSTIAFATVENVDVTARRDSTRNGSIEIVHTDLTLRNCTVLNCRAVNGGGVYIERSACLVTNNIIVNNYAEIFGGGICSVNSRNRFLNNTICYNAAWNTGGGIELAAPEFDEVQNNILHANTGRIGLSQIAYYQTTPSQFLLGYNFIGTDTTEPKIDDAAGFRLVSGSVCIDAGNPAPEFLDVNGSRNDQGAYGGPYSPVYRVVQSFRR